MRNLCVVLFLFALASTAYAQTGWIEVSKPSNVSAIFDVVQVDAQSVFATGEKSVIARSTDGGSNWTILRCAIGADISSVCFSTPTRGWVAGASGTIARSVDGGESWAFQESGVTNALQKLWFTDSLNGWAVGNDNAVLGTTNGGQTWSKRFSWHGNSFMEDARFFSSTSGLIVGFLGSNGVYRTSDGGSTWDSTSLGAAWPKAVSFLNSSSGWMVGITASYISVTWDIWGEVYKTVLQPRSTIWKTTNGGVAWDPVILTSSRWLNDVFFLDANTGWAVGDSGTVIKTTDGGTSWATLSSGTSSNLLGVSFVSAANGIAVGKSGTIIATTDGGASWSARSSGTVQEMRAVQFVNSQTGWIAGTAGTVLKTTNGGASWSKVAEGYGSRLYAASFPDSQHGWTVGSLGTIYASQDSGKSWIQQTSGSTTELEAIHFVDYLNGWAVGAYEILHTVNGGTSWAKQSTPGDVYANAVFAVSNSVAWVVGNDGAILKTTNGGAAWTAQLSGTTRDLNSVYFANPSTGWVVGDTGTVLATTNGGSNWAAQPTGTDADLSSVFFINPTGGWIVGNNSTVLRSEDGGATWGRQVTGTTTQTYSSVRFRDSSNGWIAGGWYSTILRTVDGGGFALYPPAPVAPKSSATDQSPNVVLKWKSMPQALHYRVQLSKSVSFSSTVADAAGLSDTSYATPALDSASTYYWRVSAEYTQGTSGWSAISSFETAGPTWRSFALSNFIWGYGMTFIDSVNGWVLDYSRLHRTTDGGSSWADVELPSSGSLSSIFFADPQTGWMAGAGGSAFKTQDGGSNWTQQSVGTSSNVNSIFFVNSATGWVAGAGGTLLKTTDGGSSWSAKSAGITQDLMTVFFADQSAGWLAVSYSASLLRTTDGGEGWSSYSVPFTPVSLDFVSAQTGWICGSEGQIAKSIDGGLTWIQQYSNTEEDLVSLDFVDANHGWAIGASGAVLVTTDGGATWGSQNAGTNSQLKLVRFATSKRGWILTGSGNVLRTTTGGGPVLFAPNTAWPNDDQTSISTAPVLKWHSVTGAEGYDLQMSWDKGFTDMVCDVSVVGDTSYAATGLLTDASYFWRLRTRYSAAMSRWSSPRRFETMGILWFSQASGGYDSYNTVHFENNKTGWALGTAIMKTTNGGQSWVDQNVSGYFMTGWFVDESIGWAVEWDGAVWKTTDGGTGWTKQRESDSESLEDAFFIDNQTGWIVGANGKILATRDGGSTWNTQPSGVTEDLRAVHFLNSQTGWVLGDFGRVLKTRNGGSSWAASTSGYWLHDVFFVDTLVGFGLSWSVIVKTTDGGQTWTEMKMPGDFGTLYEFAFINDHDGWAVGADGTILHTRDGERWVRRASGRSEILTSVFFINDSTGWVTGYDGVILRSGRSMIPAGVGEDGKTPAGLPEKFESYQNYPNPFNPTTAIRYELSARSYVNLKVYDVLGREVATLVNGRQNAGSYSVTFNGSQLSSGVYFYRLVAESEKGQRFVSTKKMLMVK
jgi:photosystem II stability/assembly factor-like uncharacterized protein